MPVLFRDYETRSACNLPDVGAWRYATDSSTEIQCGTYAVDDGEIKIWIPGKPVPAEFIEAAENPDWLVVAHNDAFERAIEQHILGPQYGWPIIPLEQHRCTMAMALAAALPGKLEKAAEALGLPHQKDKAGAALMRRMSKPRPDGTYIDDPESHARLREYCKRDTEAERALYRVLPPLTADEQQLWQLDAGINARGFLTDGALLDAASRVVAKASASAQTEFCKLTNLDSTNLVARFIAWLAEHGCSVKNVQKGTLRHALRHNGLAPEVRRAIELRLELAHASAAKVKALLAWRGDDGRVRGSLQYHGAATGRWVGRGPQPQNFKRDGSSDIVGTIAAVMNGGIGLASPVQAVGEIARAMIVAAPKCRLLVADFSGIESRVLAWIAGQRSKIEAWAKFDLTNDPNDDPYVIIGRSLGHPEETARAFGKIADLAFGYQGGVGAWKNFAPEDDASDQATIKRYRDQWRNQHPAVVRFWHTVDRAAIRAIRCPGINHPLGRLVFRYDEPFLRIQLPSGRSLSYPFARIDGVDKYGNDRVMFSDNARSKFSDCRFGQGAYGGLWTENIVSAIARDLLAAALIRLEAAGYPVTLHVHDEIVAEVPDDFGSVEEFQRITVALPEWAEGLPIAAKVRNGLRFAKMSKPASATPEPPPNESAAASPESEPQPEPTPRTNGGDSWNHAGSKAEAERDTYAEDRADEPFSDTYLLRLGYLLAIVFNYTLPDATVLYWQNRYELKPGITPTKKKPRKRFLAHRPVNGKDVFDAGERRVLYNWPAVMRAGPGSTIIVTEGEANANACIEHGLLATTVLSHKWTPECISALTGYHVIILQDHDTGGIAIAAATYKALAPVAASIRIVTTEHLWKHLPTPRALKPGDDVQDWLKQPGADPAKLIDICCEIPADGIIPVQPYDFPEEKTIKPYDWLYGRFLLRGEVVGTAAMGGTGKSSKSIVEALALTSGRPLLGEDVPHPLRVILINLEDTRNTMDKRILAVMKHYGLSKADIGDRLIVYAKRELKIKIARQLRSGDVARNEQTIHALTRLAIENRADVISLDSFVRAHSVGENDNSAIEEVVECFEDVASEAQCGVSLWHHTRKAGGERATIENARGAVAFVDACRSVRILETMSEKEHGELKSIKPDMRPAGYYFRAFNGKRNFAPPADQSTWFEIKSEMLLNGDDIGVVTAWKYPAERTDISSETTETIFADIESGTPAGQRYSSSNSAKKRSAWLVVQKHCPRKTDTQCRSIVATWIKSGALYEANYHDPVDRKQRTGLYVRKLATQESERNDHHRRTPARQEVL
jgi:DNA polymerase